MEQPNSAAQASSPGPPAVAAAPAKPSDALPANQTGGFDGARAFAHVEKLVSIGVRYPGSPGIRAAQEYIKSQLEGAGCKVDEDNFEAQTPVGRVSMRNIVAKVPGKSANIILLSTHYDSVRLPLGFVGANDSGSSTGLMLELARILCKRENALTIWITFFDGEEALQEWSDADSLYGSRQMAAKLALSGDLKRVKAMINADMIGDKNLNILSDDNSTPWLRQIVFDTAKRLGYQKEFSGGANAIGDDHMPFIKRGVAALDVIDLDYPPWHTLQDTLDKVSARSLGVVGHVILVSIPEIEKKIRE